MFFPHLLHNYKRKNKSPKILIFFPFFGPNTHFPLNILPVELLYNKIFQVKDWGFKWGERSFMTKRMVQFLTCIWGIAPYRAHLPKLPHLENTGIIYACVALACVFLRLGDMESFWEWFWEVNVIQDTCFNIKRWWQTPPPPKKAMVINPLNI